MNTTRQQLAQIIAEKSLHIQDVQGLAKEIAAYLMDQNQTNILDSLIRDIIAYRIKNGIVEASTISAHNLSPKDIDDIKSILKTEYPKLKSLMIDQVQDSNEIGGVKLNLPDKQLDLTVRSRLNKFKQFTVNNGGA